MKGRTYCFELIYPATTNLVAQVEVPRVGFELEFTVDWNILLFPQMPGQTYLVEHRKISRVLFDPVKLAVYPH